MLTFGSSLNSVVAASWIKSNLSFSHKADRNFLKLIVPLSMNGASTDSQVIDFVVVFIQVYMMNNLAFTERFSTGCIQSYRNVLSNITRLVCIGVIWLQEVVIAISKAGAFAPLPFGFCYQNQGCNANGKSKSTSTRNRSLPNTGQPSGDGMTCEPGRNQIPSGLMSSAEGSPVRTSVQQTTRARGSMAREADSGLSTSALFAIYSHGLLWQRTCQPLLFEDSTQCSAVLPKAGLMRNGKLYLAKCWARRTKETGFSLWPTAQASDSKRMQFSREAHLKQQARNRRLGFGTGPAGLNLVAHCQIELGGCPTANFAEWLMGFPMNWTAIEGLATPSSPKSQNGSEDES